MCATCGCSSHTQSSDLRYRSLGPGGATLAHLRAAHAHARPVEPAQPTRVDLEARVLAKNDACAQRNRAWLDSRNIVALNLLSSPGSGKTTLLERTLRDLYPERTFGVIEGDQETTLDADRIRATGCAALQINTGAGCHLEAEMVGRALDELSPPPGSVVMIENVGNLVCPALFDLGENARVVLVSVTEGDDKPLKYPHMFRAATMVLLTKIDLLPYVQFDVARCARHVRHLNPDAQVLQLSAQTGAGLADWYDWLRRRMPAERRPVSAEARIQELR